MPTSRAASARHYVFVRHRHNWLLLTKFSLVGGSGVFVNLAVYSAFLHVAGEHRFLLAAVVAFLVANTSNYLLNKFWTFKLPGRANVHLEYSRFLAVGLVALALNLVILRAMVALLDASPLAFLDFAALDAVTDKHVGQLVAIVLVTPVSFIGNKLWTFGAARVRHRHEP